MGSIAYQRGRCPPLLQRRAAKRRRYPWYSLGGLSDVDLDSREAVDAAPYFLPPTGATFGRAGRRCSRWLYRTGLAETRDSAVITYLDPCAGKDDKTTLVELRIGGGGKGAQTVFPGSVHESGETISWEDAGDPAEVEGDDLHRKVAHLAAAALLARHWSEGVRHKAACPASAPVRQI